MEPNFFRNQGWQCPQCGYCYSPSMSVCINCNRPDHEKTVFSTGDVTLPETLPNNHGQESATTPAVQDVKPNSEEGV